MTQQHLSFGSISQFRNTVKTVIDRSEHHKIGRPTLKFHGTVKLHGTNASVVMERGSSEFYAQSRTNVLSLTADNNGFYAFAKANQADLSAILQKAAGVREHFLWSHLGLYGEWCGGSIQKGVALTKLPTKMFVIFGVRLYLSDESSYWFTPEEIKNLTSPGHPTIKNIEHFPTWEVEVDFDKPEIAQNTFVELTQAVENECPFGKAHDIEGVGEGIVWSCVGPGDFVDVMWKEPHTWQDLGFKTKGAKHSDTHVKTIVQVDAEKIESVRTFIENVLTDHRLDKMLDKVREQGLDPLDIKNTGVFLKLVNQDVEREEADVIVASGFIWKDIVGQLNRQAREWYMEKLKTF